MIKNILIATDGSPLAKEAVKAGVELARLLGAKVTGYFALEPIPLRVYEEGYSIGGTTTVKMLKRYAQEIGEKHIAGVAKAATDAGVPYAGVVDEAESPHDGIIKAAKKNKCDLIVIASHGRGGLADLVLGSVTHKVLTYSKIPVLVYR